MGQAGDTCIFWDFENVVVPNWCKASAAANAIREVVLPHGRITERRLYYDSAKATSSTDRIGLDLSGFTLVDCPTRGTKETLDKKLIVDVMHTAWEKRARDAAITVVLITSDGDYAYTIARLRDIGVKTVVIYGPLTQTADVLLDSCDVALSWIHDVLPATLNPAVDEPEPASADSMSASPDLKDRVKSATPRHLAELSESEDTCNCQHFQAEALLDGIDREGCEDDVSVVDQIETEEGRHLILLNCVHGSQTGELRNFPNRTWQNCMTPDATVSKKFYKKRGLHCLPEYRAVRNAALRAGLIHASFGAPRHESHPNPLEGHTKLMYLCLTMKGRSRLGLPEALDRS